jgi:hypothetical protein
MTIKISKLSVLLGIFAIFLHSCGSSKIDTIKPEQDKAAPLTYKSVPSVINIPVKISFEALQNEMNIQLNDLIYNDSLFEKDNMQLKLWKTGSILVENDEENPTKIRTVFPLRAEVKYRYGLQKLGIGVSDIRTFILNGKVTLLSEAEMSNFRIRTKTILKKAIWTEQPMLLIGEREVPVTYLAYAGVNLFKNQISESIDESLNKTLDFRPKVIELLKKLNEPVLVSEQYQSWLQMRPIELYSTNSKIKNGEVSFGVGMKCEIENRIGKKPSLNFNEKKLAFHTEQKLPKTISTTTVFTASYQDVSSLLTKALEGKQFKAKSKRISVQDVQIWNKNNKLVVSLLVSGDLNGTIYLTGVPKYDNISKEFYVDGLDYTLETQNKLAKAASWFMKSMILSDIETKCRYSVEKDIANAKKEMAFYFNNYSPVKNVFFNGKINSMKVDNFQLTNTGIVGFVRMDAYLAISIKDE